MIKELEKIENELNKLYDELPAPYEKNYREIISRIDELWRKKWSLFFTKNRIDKSLHL